MPTRVSNAEKQAVARALNRTGAGIMLQTLGRVSGWSLRHSETVTEDVMEYGARTAMPSELRRLLGIAANLHDIAKLQDVYQPLLRSTEKLSDDQKSIMAGHAAGGAELIDSLYPDPRHPFDGRALQLASLVCRYHHSSDDAIRANYNPDDYGIYAPSTKFLCNAVSLIMLADHMDAVTSPLRPHGLKLTDPQAALGEVLPRLRTEHDSVFGAPINLAAERMASIVADRVQQAA